MHSSIGIEIAAPAESVFDLARRVDRWERLLPHYSRSRVVERSPEDALVVDFVARRPLIGVLGLGLPVAWRSRTWNEPETLRLRFRHVAGATRGMDVTWRIEPTVHGCRVTIEHEFTPRVPGFAAFVDRWFTRPIAGRTLATFKVLAEALGEASVVPTPASAVSGPPSAESEPVPMTNIRS